MGKAGQKISVGLENRFGEQGWRILKQRSGGKRETGGANGQTEEASYME